uniref:ATP synthase complex subunit 8 n=1 Tax=Neophonus bruchi TaxID=1143075 RepID=A0A0S2M7U4_9COLE|nr:ATP synthase F0 subunit 8 [Neophonus bruchi]
MPQMAPMNWLMLFFMFTLIFLLLNSINYFSYKYNINLKNKNFYKNMILWKW